MTRFSTPEEVLQAAARRLLDEHNASLEIGKPRN